MSNRYFIGFSTVDSQNSRQRVFYDLELCKRDLMNHFHTRPGERVMRPEWGCRIWDFVMEPLTPGIKEIITEEVLAVINADSRCEPVSVKVNEIEQGFIIEITINFIPARVVDTFAVEFASRNSTFS